MYRDQNQRDFARDLRNNCTPAEKRLWHFLRAGKLGVKFRRQWFLVPLPAIDEAIQKIKDGTIGNFRYDPELAKLSPA